MDTDRREQIRRSLVILAESQRANLAVLAQALSLLGEELPSAAPPAHHYSQPPSSLIPAGLALDHDTLTVGFGGRTCFLGNTLPFRLLARLAQRPGRYFGYEELLSDVWEGCRRSDASVRSVVKVLRRKLREAGMGELADAIDGSVPGRYALKLRG